MYLQIPLEGQDACIDGLVLELGEIILFNIGDEFT